MKRVALMMLFGIAACLAEVADETWTRDLNYRETVGGKAMERCVLDICAPAKARELPVIVWFHGGGLTQGEKTISKGLRGQGVVIVAPNYRLSPKVPAATCIEDAAAAVAWTFKHVADYGGDPSKIVVSGHSAGGYLASMVGLDKRWLAKHDIDADRLAGLVPFSGHTITHFTIRKERGIKGEQPVIDAFAPLFHVRKDSPPMLLITGDRELELLGRYEENAYFWRMMQVVGHPDCVLHEIDGRNHGQMVDPGFPLLLRFIATHCVEKAKP